MYPKVLSLLDVSLFICTTVSLHHSEAVSNFHSITVYHHHSVIGLFHGILYPCQYSRVAAASMVQYSRVMCVATASIGFSRGWSRGHSWARPLAGPPSSPRLVGHSVLSVLNPTLAGRLYRNVRYICSA